jgi:hypothetical protein
MLKNPVVLVGIALGIAALVWVIASRVDHGAEADLTPLKPPAGESLRRQGTPPKPVRADPKQAAERLAAAAVLPAGDLVLRELLRKALADKEDPCYRAMVDVPLTDNAGQQVKDEFKDWLARKLASLGFAEAVGKPTVLFTVHIDPAAEGKYSIQIVMRSGGEPKFDEKFDLPAAFGPNRMDAALAKAFAPAPPSPAAAAPQGEKKP